MSDNERYVSDNDSDLSDYGDDGPYAEPIGGTDDADEADDALLSPADPDEGVDEDSDADYYESEPEPDDDDDATPADEIEEEIEEEIDLKQISNYNKEIIVIKPENRRTSNIMSKYEMTEIVSIRATQISQYNNCMVETTGLDDPIKMAKRELMMRKCPLELRRHLGDIKGPDGDIISYYEFWLPNEMQFAVTYTDVL